MGRHRRVGRAELHEPRGAVELAARALDQVGRGGLATAALRAGAAEQVLKDKGKETRGGGRWSDGRG